MSTPKFKPGDKVFSTTWRTTGVVADPEGEDAKAFTLFQNLYDDSRAVYVIHDNGSRPGIYFEEELQHA